MNFIWFTSLLFDLSFSALLTHLEKSLARFPPQALVENWFKQKGEMVVMEETQAEMLTGLEPGIGDPEEAEDRGDVVP